MILPADTRVLALWQPWATLWADPALPKTIETRPQPIPSTIPLPAWVLIHAAMKRPEPGWVGDAYVNLWADGEWHIGHAYKSWPDEPALPLGAVIGAAHITESLPMHGHDWPTDIDCIGVLSDEKVFRWTGGGIMSDMAMIVADLPYGDYRPGRWGYVTDRTVLFSDPIPWHGMQGWQRSTAALRAAAQEQMS